ncbi:hypothetical protein HID58_045957 [Brassica napus]|uniref:(rape) hypothetical protein n=1 Tax=Brassica napus TaxID=3708 RepID=A0A816JPC7_BRANA|nr:hypothetical protein HID58_045957 [Brassica napus]CAF1891753.1 unnamed protein product [Brassica napus]
MGCVWTAEVWTDDVATGDVWTETSRYCSAWTRSLKTRGVDSGDVLLGEVGADEPSTANRPIHSIAVIVPVMRPTSWLYWKLL